MGGDGMGDREAGATDSGEQDSRLIERDALGEHGIDQTDAVELGAGE